MISKDDIRAARERSEWTQEQLGHLVGVTHRTIGNWERGASVPRNRLAKLEEVLADHLGAGDEGATLRSASDAEVLAEIARRFSRTPREEGQDDAGSAAIARAPVSGAQVSEVSSETFQRSQSLDEGASPGPDPGRPGRGRDG